jgi:hypothetical protein
MVPETLKCLRLHLVPLYCSHTLFSTVKAILFSIIIANALHSRSRGYYFRVRAADDVQSFL